MTIRTQKQIDKYVVRLIRNKYPIATEQKLSRISHGATMGTYTLSASEQQELADYQSYVETCRDTGEQMAIDSDLERRTLAYNNALSRLNKVIAEDGRLEQTIPDTLDEFDNVIEQGYTIKAIEPILPLMVDVITYDDLGELLPVTQEVNKIIQKDRLEREQAQAVIDLGEPV